MRIVQLHFYLLVCCGAAESFTEKLVDLGQNVTLKCEVAVKDVLWFLMKPSEPPAYILRSFTRRPTDLQYNNPAFSKTFSTQYNSTLFIHNISTNELGVYYCIQAGSPPDISSGVRLYIQSLSAGNQAPAIEQPHRTPDAPEAISHWSIPLIISVIINVTLAVVVTVFTVYHCRKLLDTRTEPQNTYANVKFSKTKGCIRMDDLNSTYALLEAQNLRPGMTQSNPTNRTSQT